MEGIASCSVSPSAVLVNPNCRNHHPQAMLPFPSRPKPNLLSFPSFRSSKPSVAPFFTRSHAGDDEDEDEDEAEVVERALGMDGSIPASADELVKRVSSRAYEMRSQLKSTIGSSSYDGADSLFPLLFLFSHDFRSRFLRQTLLALFVFFGNFSFLVCIAFCL